MNPARPARSCLPSAAVLELTYRCNHRCLFCCCPWEAADGGFERGAELSLTDWKECVDRLLVSGVTSFTFSGGESTLFGGLSELIEFAASRAAEHVETVGEGLVMRAGPPRLFLLTNGRELSDDLLQLCREREVHLSLSLPGMASYRELTGSDTDPQRVLGWLRRAHELGVRTTANVTVTRPNLAELERTLGEALCAGADFLLLNRFLPGGRGLAMAEELALGPEEIVQMLQVAESVLRRARRRGGTGTEVPLCLAAGLDLEFLQLSSRCAA
ncbi:MAG: radical SAM protein, partial [Deltaproteobacteria bacterium]|nr:radical SAM protein [Deltaproteobacteria bacterium]